MSIHLHFMHLRLLLMSGLSGVAVDQCIPVEGINTKHLSCIEDVTWD